MGSVITSSMSINDHNAVCNMPRCAEKGWYDLWVANLNHLRGFGIEIWKKNAFLVNVWQNYEFPSKNAGNWGILCWDQWSQRNMPICVEKDWYNLHMERKSPDGPPLSMQNIDGKLFWISSLASLVDPSFWSRERVCYQIFGPVWSCLHEWPEFEMILDRMSLTSPGPKL